MPLLLAAKDYAAAAEFFEAAARLRPEKASDALLVWGLGLMTGERFYYDRATLMAQIGAAR